MTSNELASYQFDAASRITGIIQNLWSTPLGSGQSAGRHTPVRTPITWSVGYDSQSRVTSFNRLQANGSAGNRSTSYTYDANSNRLAAVNRKIWDIDLDGDFDEADKALLVSQSLKIAPNSNRLLGFSQTVIANKGTRTISMVSASVSYALDAAGNITSDGLRIFGYDANNRHSQTQLGGIGYNRDHDQSSSSGSGHDNNHNQHNSQHHHGHSDHDRRPQVNYLHNALGQRVFKSEPNVGQTEPNEHAHGSVFTHWLRNNFAWLFGRHADKDRNQLGIAFTYDDVIAGSSNTLLGEYGSGGNYSAGRSEYIWLPMVSGEPVPVGVYRNGRLYAIHSDHLTTPRQITDDKNQVVWQWPYAAFGETKPTGVLQSIRYTQQGNGHSNVQGSQANNLLTNTQLKATEPAIDFNLRFPGQYSDWETGLFYNGFRSYSPNLGAYTQMDPMGLSAGLNRRGYVQVNALQYTDPTGEFTRLPSPQWSAWPNFAPGVRTDVSPRPPAPPPYNPVTDTYTPAPPAPTLPTPYIPIPVVTIINTIVDLCSDTCSPPVGTQCYEGPDTTHTHAGLNPHFHIYQMFKFGGRCQWKYLGGKVGVGVLARPPSGMSSCSSYSGFTGR